MAHLKYLLLPFTVIVMLPAGCVGTTASNRQQLPTSTVVRTLRILLPHWKEKEWQEIFPKLSPEEADLCVRSLAAIYWSGKAQDYGCSGDDAISRLGMFGSDRAREEMMRFGLYGPPSNQLCLTMWHFVYFFQGSDLFPFFSKLLDRKDLPKELLYGIRERRAFCLSPARFNDVWETVRKLDLPASAAIGKRHRLVREAWDKALTTQTKLGKALFETHFKSQVIALRRARGFDGAVYPPPYQGPGADVQVVLRVLKEKRRPSRKARPSRELSPR